MREAKQEAQDAYETKDKEAKKIEKEAEELVREAATLLIEAAISGKDED